MCEIGTHSITYRHLAVVLTIFAFQIGLQIHKGNLLLLTEKVEYQDSESVFLSERICLHKQESGRGKSDSHVDDICISLRYQTKYGMGVFEWYGIGLFVWFLYSRINRDIHSLFHWVFKQLRKNFKVSSLATTTR